MLNNTLDALAFDAPERAGTDDLRQLVAEAVRAALPASDAPGSVNQSLVLELDRAQFARAVYRSDDEERRRVGVSLVKGGL